MLSIPNYRTSVTLGSTVLATSLLVLVAGGLDSATETDLVRATSAAPVATVAAEETAPLAPTVDTTVIVVPALDATVAAPAPVPPAAPAAAPATTAAPAPTTTTSEALPAAPAPVAARTASAPAPAAPSKAVASTTAPAPQPTTPATTTPAPTTTTTTAPPPPPPTTAPAPPARSSKTVACEADMARMINEARGAAGLRALANDSGIAWIPIKWSERMASRQNLAHNPDYANQIFAARAQATTVSENVGFGGGSNRALFDAFMDSSGHRANILGKYTHVTVGCAHDADGKVWATMNFWG